MKIEMNKNTFFNILNESGVIEAMKYKDSFIPNILYKYFPIFDDRFVNFEKENEIRLNTLSRNMIWVSNYKTFNDPFEFKMFALDIERLESRNWDIKHIEKILETFKDRTLVSCFSCEVDNNMPLWAHYANNHFGYCIKYTNTNQRQIYPVSYEPLRTRTATIPAILLNEMAKSYREKLEKPTEDFYKYFTYFYFSLACKHQFWNYENEYRLLYNAESTVDGLAVPLEDIGLHVEALYIGINCKEIYKQELISIGRKLKCDIFEMYFDEYSEAYELKAKKL